MNDSKRKPHILALVPNWLGDIAMCTPALRALRRRYADGVLTAAGPAAACALLEGLDWIDKLVPVPRRPGPRAMMALGRQLRAHAPDVCVVFPHSFRAALLARLTGATRRIGYRRGGRTPLLTDPVAPYRENGKITPIYMAREYLDLVAPLGCENDGKGLELHADPGEVEAVRGLLADANAGSGRRPVVGFAPGAAFGPSKCWPPERYARVANTLIEQLGATAVLMTGPGEADTRAAILDKMRHPMLECHDGNPTIARLKAAISQVDLLICNDSGPRHIAVAFGKPVVCVMGPTSPRYSEGPWEKGRVLRVDVDCGPCQKPVCTTDFRCMTQITPEMVVRAALEFLDA